MSYKLKACPFCGETPQIYKAESGPYKGMFRCFHRCSAIGYIEIFDWTESVTPSDIRGWNTRPKLSTPTPKCKQSEAPDE